MGNLSKLLLISGFLGIPFFSGFSQPLEGCDYLRKINTFNRVSEKKAKYNSNLDFPEYSNFKEPFKDESRNSFNKEIMSVYFQTNNHELTKNDSSDLRDYCLKIIKPNLIGLKAQFPSFIIEAFADCRGDAFKNYILSMKRAESTAKYLKTFFPKSTIYISAFGEKESIETVDSLELQKYRVSNIFVNKDPRERALELCNADIFLLDQTGSNKHNWGYLQSYYYPDSAGVFSFSKLTENTPINSPEARHTGDIKEEIAWGNTCYYDAKNKLLSLVPNKITITTFVNEMNNLGKENPNDIIQKANQKNINLNMVVENLSPNFAEDLIKISSETGGKYYSLKKFN